MPRRLRSLALGSRSQGGERTIERLLSVDQTCRLQRRSLHTYLADVLAARAPATLSLSSPDGLQAKHSRAGELPVP